MVYDAFAFSPEIVSNYSGVLPYAEMRFQKVLGIIEFWHDKNGTSYLHNYLDFKYRALVKNVTVKDTHGNLIGQSKHDRTLDKSTVICEAKKMAVVCRSLLDA